MDQWESRKLMEYTVTYAVRYNPTATVSCYIVTWRQIISHHITSHHTAIFNIRISQLPVKAEHGQFSIHTRISNRSNSLYSRAIIKKDRIMIGWNLYYQFFHRIEDTLIGESFKYLSRNGDYRLHGTAHLDLSECDLLHQLTGITKFMIGGNFESILSIHSSKIAVCRGENYGG